ncbi:MAG: hypothetical protein R3F35_20315 [Myxococcota bacterium]
MAGPLHDPSPVPALDAAWRSFRDGIEALRRTLHGMSIVRSASDHAAADRWLMQAQAAAHNLVLAPDPRNPRFLLHNVFEPGVYGWLLPNPDFLYRYAFVDGAGTYRIEGVRRPAHFLDAQVISGFWGDADMKLMASYDFDALGIAPGSAVDVHVGPSDPGAARPWIRTDPGSGRNTLIVREAFYDWEKEARSSLRIASTSRELAPHRSPDAAETARRIEAALRMIRFCHGTFSGGLTANVVDAVGYNRFLLLDTSRDEDAANPVAGYVPVVFDLAPDEALVLEFELPDASYWGLQLGDLFWQAADYVDHQSSLNGRQVEVDSDGRVRVVLAREDPGVANWLDTTGLARGIALLRWYRADRHPVPVATRMPRAEVARALPAETQRVDPAERARRRAARRAAVLRRYED